MRRLAFVVCTLLLILVALSVLTSGAPADPRLKRAFRRPQNNGWTFVHLEGKPSEIGFQHGYLLAPEIRDGYRVWQLEMTHDNKKDWQFFRDAAKNMLWPHIEQQYREELQGIADGLKARGEKFDLWDVVAVNASLEWGYYVAQYDKEHGIAPPAGPAEHCSAFVATGSYTKDGRVVMAHNSWTNYLDGERWTMIFDIVPSAGHRFIMDGYPGLIHSADDFGINDAGIMITETTISKFAGWDANGIAEFVRARKAMQYSESIDDFARIMKEGNNGGYANDWLVADRKTNEIASLELGLKNVTLERKKDGYFAGANFPINEALAREETTFDLKDMGQSPNARRLRWQQLMEQNKGKIDLAAAQRFEADHFDTFTGKQEPSERTLCGHVELSPRGYAGWVGAYSPTGAVQNKAADAALAERLSLTASAGHSCGIDFKASEHLKKHAGYEWQAEFLRDMKSQPWTTFSASK